jgi:hypothetical protein
MELAPGDTLKSDSAQHFRRGHVNGAMSCNNAARLQ